MGTIKGHTFECIPNSHVFHLVPILGKYDQLVLIKVSSSNLCTRPVSGITFIRNI